MKKTDQRCECGAEMPMHLVSMLSSHTCTCGRKYKPNAEKNRFVLAGEEKNPIAEYDFGQMKGPELYEYSKKMYEKRRQNPHRETLPHPTEAEFDQLIDAAHLAWNDDHEVDVPFLYGVASDTDKKGVCRGLRIWVKQLTAPRGKVLHRMELSGPNKDVILRQMIFALDIIAGKRHSMPPSAIERLREYIAAQQRKAGDTRSATLET